MQEESVPIESPAERTRRPIAARNTEAARALTRACIRLGLTPNAISLLGLAFSVAAAVLLLLSPEFNAGVRAAMLAGAAACIQLRLLCNLIDGMVAIEGGRHSAVGPIFNELPDRFADAVTLVAAGLIIREPAWGPALGWTAALLALITAYVRTLGAAEGTPHHFIGPMAKQQRMALMTAACAVAIFEPLWEGRGEVFAIALALVILGGAVTIVRRLRRIGRDLRRLNA